ncbi:PepSY-associated TM helix domain-containing protein [Paracoccus laeviglucosivorans]|uniref:Uncharacterized iron-regulated membrane protein n=1 Tax=Paracoccus laeviglucosivorans TaxID=1197861 RepID=A0A521BC22_9RHOB|nr:PepSY domain-containing protein [Paracoccus laeviglucosivorans]SMO44632.1 Uncharacterized iron-regulated membrane protein [Paracoccus laeviglucosivorans]
MTTLSRPSRPARAAGDLYRAVWRWHFYAGLLVLPFLISLSLSGGAYLFKDEIDGWYHSDLKHVAQMSDVTISPDAILASAQEVVPGTAVKFTPPAKAGDTAEVTIATDRGRMAVYVSPYDGLVQGVMPDRTTLSWTIRQLHSLKYFGPYARYAIEIAAGWSVLLVATGLFLWWPRGQKGGVLSVRGTPQRRVFWRDLHAVTGLVAGGFIVFLAVTGMPWSGVWGANVNEWANGSNFGYPSGVRVDVPMSDRKLNDIAQTSWSLEHARIPESPNVGASSITLEQAVAAFDRMGLAPGYAVSLPVTPDGVFTGSVYPDDLSRQRVVHLDQYSGKPLLDMSYGDYGPGGRALEWGINTHLGQTYGLANQIVLLAVCMAIILMSVAAAAMWWKRRPAGRLGVPPMPQNRRVFRGLIAMLALGGVIFPLVGLSLIVMLSLDFCVTRWGGNRGIAAT